MATGTVTETRCGIQQFQGLFENVMVLKFTLDTGSISANSTTYDTVAVPGVTTNCVVLGWNSSLHLGDDLIHELHTATDELHVVTHNNSGVAVNPPTATYTVVIGKLRTP